VSQVLRPQAPPPPLDLRRLGCSRPSVIAHGYPRRLRLLRGSPGPQGLRVGLRLSVDAKLWVTDPSWVPGAPPVIPLFEEDDRGRPLVRGSGCVLRLGGESFLLTAGHVLFDPKPATNLYTFVQRHVVPLNGEMIAAAAAEIEGRPSDKYDLGIVRLEGDLLPATYVLPSGMSSTPRFRTGQPLVFSGWPASRSKASVPRKRVHGDLSSLTLPALEEKRYEALELNPAVHIAARVDLNDLHTVGDRRVGAPELHGISGGGVFRAIPTVDRLSQATELIGIIVGFADDRRTCLYGVRLNLFLSYLAAQHPELLVAMPSSLVQDPEFQGLLASFSAS
jgi:hypothetical protein